jgi:hypothetical protein
VVALQARILDDGAKATTTRIRRDHRNGIEPHEETLTQNFVSDYVARVRRAKMRARANEFTKRQEAQLFGADVALWFVNAAGQFAGIYLQAKVLRRDDSYRGLNHSNRWGPQNQTLIDAGNRDGVLAGYAFYNGLSGSQPAQSVCGHGEGAPDINGINIASATSMTAHLKGRVARTDVEALCSPLSCLVRHWGGGGSAGGSGGVASPGTGGGGGPAGGDGSRGTGEGEDSLAPDLPAALLGLSQSWEQPEARLMGREEVPQYVSQLAETLDLAWDDVPYDEDRGYVRESDDWWFFRSGPGPVRWSDVNPFFTAVLVGPKEQ